MILETVDISDISQDPANVRKHSDRNLEAIAASLRAFGQQKPIVVDKRGVILAGNGTYEAAKRIGWDKIQITRTDLSGTMATAYAIADNRTAELAEWDDTALAEQLRALQSEEFDLANVGYTDDEVQQLIDGIGNELLNKENNDSSDGPNTNNVGAGALSARFGIPPFSVLNAREGWWQNRKQAWMSLGIKSELGRGGGQATPPHPPTVTRNIDGTLNYSGTQGQSSRFDSQRQPNATPGGGAMPAANYSKSKARGDGQGRPLKK